MLKVIFEFIYVMKINFAAVISFDNMFLPCNFGFSNIGLSVFLVGDYIRLEQIKERWTFYFGRFGMGRLIAQNRNQPHPTKSSFQIHDLLKSYDMRNSIVPTICFIYK